MCSSRRDRVQPACCVQFIAPQLNATRCPLPAPLQLNLNISNVMSPMAGHSSDLPPYTAVMWFNVRLRACSPCASFASHASSTRSSRRLRRSTVRAFSLARVRVRRARCPSGRDGTAKRTSSLQSTFSSPRLLGTKRRRSRRVRRPLRSPSVSRGAALLRGRKQAAAQLLLAPVVSGAARVVLWGSDRQPPLSVPQFSSYTCQDVKEPVHCHKATPVPMSPPPPAPYHPPVPPAPPAPPTHPDRPPLALTEGRRRKLQSSGSRKCAMYYRQINFITEVGVLAFPPNKLIKNVTHWVR